MKIDIKGRWVWITGASSGIGEKLAEEAARRGAGLILSGRRVEALKRVAERCSALSKAGGYSSTHEILPFDLLDKAARAAAVQKALALSGGIALLVLNAGISQRGRFEQTTPEAFEMVMELDFFAPVDIVRRMLPSFASGAPSGILLVASLAGLFGAPQRSAYVSAKHALSGFGSTLRGELLERRIAVTTAYPGYVRTGIAQAAIGGDGKTYGLPDPDIEGGADPAPVAAKIMAAALAGRPEIRLAQTFETRLALFLSRRLPRVFTQLSARKGRAIEKRRKKAAAGT